MQGRTLMTAVPARLVVTVFRAESWLHSRLQQIIFRTALTRAYGRIARQHPMWADALVDEYFLSDSAAPLLQRFAWGEPLGAAELTAAWCVQLPHAHHIAGPALEEIRTIAAVFLREFQAELDTLVPPALGALFGAGATQADISGVAPEPLPYASELLAQALREDSNIEMDWLWLAHQLKRQNEQVYCYRRALAINRHSELAQRELRRLLR